MSLAKMLQPRVCELGKIKIGGLGEERVSRSGGKYRVPVKYDEFHVTTLNRDASGLLVDDAALMAALPKDADGKLRSLPVSLLSNSLEEVMQASYLWYNGKRLAGKSDGERLTIHFDHRAQKWLDEPKVVPWSAEYADLAINGAPLFKLHCTLNVVIASQTARFGGLYKFRTTSRITSDQLYGSLVQLRQLTGGVLRGLPLRLVVRPMQVAPNGVVTTIYVVHVELQGADIAAIQARALELAQFEVQHVRQLAAAQAEYKQLLAAPDEFDDEVEEAEVAQEFHPHQQDGQPGRLPERSDPDGGALADQRAALEQAETLDELGAVWTALPPKVQGELLAEKDARKAALSKPAEPPPAAAEGEQRADPRATAPTAAPTPATGATVTPPSSASPPTAPATDADVPMAGGAIVGRLLELMHEVGVAWTEVRDGTEGKGAEIAAATGLAKMPPGAKVSALTAAEALRLKAELEARVSEKKARAAKRAEGAARKAREEGAVSA